MSVGVLMLFLSRGQAGTKLEVYKHLRVKNKGDLHEDANDNV